MLGKIEYDVEVPEIERPVSEMEKFFVEFMKDASHKSVSVDYGDSDSDSNGAAKKIHNVAKKLNADVTINKRGCVVYITKKSDPVQENESVSDDVVIPDSVSEKKKKLDVGKVMALYKAGWKQKDIAGDMGCSQALICQTIKAHRK